MSTSLPVILGLTGGIASGKSTVTALLTALGAHVIDADVIAREVVEPGQPALAEIVAAFGPSALDAQGRLDRAAIGQRVFQDPSSRATLNAIVHPRVAQAMIQRAQRAGQAGFAWVIYDAALIVENGLHGALDSLIVVGLKPQAQLARLMARDGLDAAQAQARLDAQLPLQDKIAVADYVVDNSGDQEELARKCVALYAMLDQAVRQRGSAKPDAQVVL